MIVGEQLEFTTSSSQNSLTGGLSSSSSQTGSGAAGSYEPKPQALVDGACAVVSFPGVTTTVW